MIDFVGAGPGAVDLITVRGKEKLEQADIIIYAGSLVNPELLSYARPECEIFDSAGMTLEQVAAVMQRGEAQGKKIVRLHTGDPCLFGAIREQMDLLDDQGIGYRVVPGVSSFLGAAAVLPAEFTLPDVSQTVILTRMAGRTPVPEREDIAALAAHRATMVVFLSASMLGKLSERLQAGGYSADTPAAVVYKATWPDEKVLRTTVGQMERDAREAGISKTALILVGGFLGRNDSRSKLYDPAFSHGYRESV